jgi:hypothetical protein
VLQDLLIIPRVLECVSKNGHAVEGTLFVDAGGEGEDGGSTSGGVERDGAEGVSEDVMNEQKLLSLLNAAVGDVGCSFYRIPRWLRGHKFP